MSQGGPGPDLLEHHGQLGKGDAHAPHDVHDLAVFGLLLVFLQLLEPGLLFADFGLDLINLGLDFLAFAYRHRYLLVRVNARRRRNEIANSYC